MGGTTLTSELVSTKKWVCVCKSLMKTKQLGHSPGEEGGLLSPLMFGLGVFPIAWLLAFLSCLTKFDISAREFVGEDG